MKDSHKKIKSLFYIVAIISMIIAIFGKVNAAGADSVSDFSEYIYNIYNSCNVRTEYTDSYLIDAINTSVNFVHIYNDYEHVFVFGNKDSLTCNCGFYYGLNTETHKINGRNSVGYQISKYPRAYSGNYYSEFYAEKPVPNISECIVYYMYVTFNEVICSKVVYSSNTNFQNLSNSPNYQVALFENKLTLNNNDGTYSALSLSTLVNNNMVDYVCYGDNSYCKYNGEFYCYDLPEYYTNDMLNPTIDNNFSIYKTYGNGGISDPLLNIQYLDDLFSSGYVYTSETTYNLTFDVDGSSVTVPISSNTYPDDFFDNGMFRTSYDLIYRMLSNKVLDFSSVDNVTLTQVSLSATAYPTADHQGIPETVSKSTLCNLVLKGSQGSTDIESDVIPDITDVTIVYDQVVGSDDFVNHTGSYNLNQPVPSWANTYIIVMYTDGNYGNGKPWSSVDLYFNYEDFLYFNFGGYTDPNLTFNGLPDQYIDYNHMYSNVAFPEYLISYLGLLNSCDVVRFVYGVWGNDGWISQGDFVFYLQNYYNKLSIKGLGNIQSAIESGTYYTKSLYWYLKQRLDNMSDNIAEYEQKSLSNQVIGNGYLQSINTNVISIKDSIENGVNRIVGAISGISGGSSSYSLPSLSEELQRLFIPSLTWQSIDFDEYMDSLGVLSLPFTFTNDVLTVADNSYSPTLDLHINDFALDVTGNNDVLTIFEDQDYSFNPRSIFANSAWTMLTYLNAFALILGESWITYCHIFRREKSNDC